MEALKETEKNLLQHEQDVTAFSTAAFDGWIFSTVQTSFEQGCYLEIGGCPNHLARKPVPLQSEQHIDPWRNMIYGGLIEMHIGNWGMIVSITNRLLEVLTYLSSTNNTTSTSRRDLAKHVIAEHKEACAPTPFAFDMTVWVARRTSNRPWLLQVA